MYAQRTSGRYVTEDNEKIMEAKEAMAAELISGFVSDMMRLGYTREQTIRLLEKKREG